MGPDPDDLFVFVRKYVMHNFMYCEEAFQHSLSTYIKDIKIDPKSTDFVTY